MTDMTRSGALRTDRALLVLEDGTVYRGYGYGATGASLGGRFSQQYDRLPGNPTDPSYAGQIVVRPLPHIGNTGVNTTDAESRRFGLPATWFATPHVWHPTGVLSAPLDEELIEQGIVGVEGIDISLPDSAALRSSGSMRAGSR